MQRMKVDVDDKCWLDKLIEIGVCIEYKGNSQRDWTS